MILPAGSKFQTLDPETCNKVFNFLGSSDLFTIRLLCKCMDPMFVSTEHAQSLVKRLSCDVMRSTNRMSAAGRIHDAQLPDHEKKNALNVHEKTMTICHKGCSGKYHENTIPAFEEAVRIGAEMIELDIIKCKDNNVIIFHNQYLDNGELVHTTPMSVIRKLFPKIPTLREFLENETLASSDIKVYFDLKCLDIVSPLMDILVEAVNSGLWDASRFLIASFDQYDLLDVNAFKAAHNVDFKTIVIVDAMPIGFAACFEGLEVNYISIAQGRVIPEFVEDAHRRGMGVLVWTVNNANMWREFVNMGVDGICTDYPEDFQQALSLMVVPTRSSKPTDYDILSPASIYPESFSCPRANALAAVRSARPLLNFCRQRATSADRMVPEALLARLEMAVQDCEKICKRHLQPVLVSPQTYNKVIEILGRNGKLVVSGFNVALDFERTWIEGLLGQGLPLEFESGLACTKNSTPSLVS